MYNLLLVDDEPSILNGLYHNVDWDGLGIGKVHKAGLAAEALAIIRAHHIDLVITDIRMPEMDGIRLAEVIRENWPYTKIIFLTGYQDFAYAQTAVDLGVFRYMLKPVHYKDVEAVAGEAIGMLSEALAGAARVKDMEEKIRRQRPVLRERCISRWLEWGDLRLLDHEEELREYDIPLRRADWGFLLCVKTDIPAGRMQDATRLHLLIRNLAEEILFADCRMLDYHNMKSQSVLLFLREGRAAAQALQTKAVERLDAFQFALSRAVDQTFTLFWTDPAPAAEMHEVYQTLRGRMDRHIALLKNTMIGPEAHGDELPAVEIRSLMQQPSLAVIISSLRRKEVLARMAAIFAELEDFGDNEVILMQVYHEITGALVADSLHRGFQLQRWAGEYMPYFESMASVRTLERFCRTSRAVVERYLDYAVSSSLSQVGDLIAQIQAAIRQNLTRDITVASLAQKFSYHPNYLSRLFKQETKTSLQDFIISERMEAAKRMLNEGMRVGDVPRQVGYESIAHFSRIFKKVVGQSPKQFQQQQGDAGQARP